MVQTWWQKLNTNERMAATGAIIVFVLALLSGSWLTLIGAGVVIATYWLKYSPNQINWPAPIELINLVISAIIALFAVIGALFVLGLGGLGFGMLGLFGGFGGLFGGIYLLAILASVAFVIGAAMMALGTWREYQAMPKAPGTSGPPSSPPPTAPPEPPSSTGA